MEAEAAPECLLCVSLQAQVAALEHKLGVLHTSDANALRRAHASLVQHVEALEAELAGLRPLAGAIQFVAFDASSLAGDATTIGCGLAAGFFGHKIIALEPAAPFWLRVLPWVVTMSAAAARVVLHNERRMSQQAGSNRITRAALLERLRACEERVAIMRALSMPPPAVARDATSPRAQT